MSVPSKSNKMAWVWAKRCLVVINLFLWRNPDYISWKFNRQ
jgi:hypothetical protein